MKQNKGFTLLEVLVAMAIVGLLIAAAAFGIAAVQRNSRNTRRKEAAKTVKITVEDYYGNYGRRPEGIVCTPPEGSSAGTIEVNNGAAATLSTTNEVTGFETMNCTVSVATPLTGPESDSNTLTLDYDRDSGDITILLEGVNEPWVLSGGTE